VDIITAPPPELRKGFGQSFEVKVSCILQGLPISVTRGRFFVHFFSAENHFPRKIPRNFLEKRFLKTFSAENSIFSRHFWGKIFREIFRGIIPGKMYEKSAPDDFTKKIRHKCSVTHFRQN
jgi:hypothetical protein